MFLHRFAPIRLVRPVVSYREFNISRALDEHIARSVCLDHPAKLYRSAEIFKETLPRRKVIAFPEDTEIIQKLYNSEYYCVSSSDLGVLADSLTERPLHHDHARSLLRYLCAPSGQGKTACVLPAFLVSNKNAEVGKHLSHYLYMAFSNNDHRSFKAYELPVDADTIESYDLGAAYIAACVKMLVDNPGEPGTRRPYEVQVTSPAPSWYDSLKELEKFLEKRFGEGCKVLIHADEHYKMVDRVSRSYEGAQFSKGALDLLASLKCALAIASVTQQPFEVPTESSDIVCRCPIAVPYLDPEGIWKAQPSLSLARFTNPVLKGNNARMLATLKFRLCAKIHREYLMELNAKPEIHSTRFSEFLKNFKAAAAHKSIDEALSKCLQLCALPYDLSPTVDIPDLLGLLLGQPQRDVDCKLSDVLVLPNGELSLSIARLLECKDPEFDIFERSSIRFRNQLSQCKGDLLSATPLEAAYTWTLSCTAASDGSLYIGGQFYSIARSGQQVDVEAGRIFPGSVSKEPDFADLKPHTIYYAREKNGEVTHPLADLYFRTLEDQLVLIDIAGAATDRNVKEKESKLSEWIAWVTGEGKDRLPEGIEEVIGVVLAPCVVTEEWKSVPHVAVVRGHKARHLLGGLDQVFRWMV